MSMGMRSLVHHLYPRLLALHDLDDRIALPREEKLPDGTVVTRISYPSCTRDTHFFMEPEGIYMIGKVLLLCLWTRVAESPCTDNEEVVIFWVGNSVSPQLLEDLFGVDDFTKLSPFTVRDLSLRGRSVD